MLTKNKKVLVTGGLGYIGQHIVFELLENKYDVVCIDNLSNTTATPDFFIKRYNNTRKRFSFYKSLYDDIEELYEVDYVIHLAASKYVYESILNPLGYYKNNIDSTIRVLELMIQYSIRNLIYASSSVIYQAQSSIITEDSEFQIFPNSPYASSKIACERLLKDFSLRYPTYLINSLRFGNPVGYHENGLLGTKTNGNVVDKLINSIINNKPFDFYVREERNKTQIRSFIHVSDLAKLHLKFFEDDTPQRGFYAYNVSSFYLSIQELFDTAELLFNKKILKVYSGWKQGDLLISKLSCTKLDEKFGWHPAYDIKYILNTTFNYLSRA